MLDSSCYLFALFSYFFLFSFASSLPTPSFWGIAPQDEKYFESEVITCKDRSKSFSRDRLNDEFCDCIDGTDEPGTSACPEGKFYCRNVGSKPQLLFSSRVNDHICDCCDGSDEYDGSMICPNTCIKNGNILQKQDEYTLTETNSDASSVKERSSRNNLDDLIQKLKGLKVVLIAEVMLVSFIMTFGLFRRRFRFRRRRY